jgi:hypothetical protein
VPIRRAAVSLGSICRFGIFERRRWLGARWLGAKRCPPPCLGGDQGVPARCAGSQLIDAPGAERRAVELGPHAREPADIGAQPSATRCDARGEFVKSPLGLLRIASTEAVGRIRACPLPDRERQLVRQAMARSLDDRIEPISLALALELGGMQPARHRATVSSLISSLAP